MSSASKRPSESNKSELNGQGKRPKTVPFASQQAPPQGTVVFCILCPGSKSGGLVGKGGSIISKIRNETGTTIRLHEIIPGCDERHVVITGSDKYADLSKEQTKADVAESNQDDKVGDDNDEEKEGSSALEVSKSQKTTSAQRALLLVFERIVDCKVKEGVDEDDESKESNVSVKLLVTSSQVDCLQGKDGTVIKQMNSDSGAQIRVLDKHEITACASLNEEIVQITGGIDSARKALQLVSQLLLENPPYDPFPAAKPSSKRAGPSSRPLAPNPRTEAQPPVQYLPPQRPSFSNRPYDAADIPPFPNFHDSVGRIPIRGPSKELIFKLLCSNDRVGRVIGKGGSVIKSLKQETCCEIKVIATNPETDDCIIIISSPALPLDRISAAQDGVLRVQHRIAMATPDGNDNVVARLLVYSYYIRHILGKGGAIISEIRKNSGAQIHVPSKDNAPKRDPDKEEVIQVAGELRSVQDALLQITDKLKSILFGDTVQVMDHPGHPSFPDQMPPFGTYMRRLEPSPPGMFSNLPPFQREMIFHPHDERSAFAHSRYGPGIPSHSLERTSPASWGSQVSYMDRYYGKANFMM